MNTDVGHASTGHSSTGLRERKKARTREALQEAAMARFVRQGFERTTVEEIAEACEVSPRTFFRYFPTKEDVLFADAAVRRERLLAVIAERPPDETAFVALCAAMRTLATDYRNDRDALVERSRIVAASPHLQAYKAEHQHGWEVEVVDVLQRRALAQHESVTRDELALVTAVTTAALRVALDAWVADASAPDLAVLLDDAFARLAAGFDASSIESGRFDSGRFDSGRFDSGRVG
jgi:AcrR family transcriptional regulator